MSILKAATKRLLPAAWVLAVVAACAAAAGRIAGGAAAAQAGATQPPDRFPPEWVDKPAIAPPGGAERLGQGSPGTANATAPDPDTGTRGYDVLNYDLAVTLFIPSKTEQGAVGIDLSASRGGLDRIALDLVDTLQVDRLEWQPAGSPPPSAATRSQLAFTHEGDSLVVLLPTPLEFGTTGRLTVEWHGKPPPHGPYQAGLMFRTYGDETRDDPTDDGPIVASVSEPSSAHSWWPCKDHPADKATATITIEVPDTLTAISNGKLVDVGAPQPGWKRFVWREDHPIATYLVSLAVSNYASWTETCDCAAAALRLDYSVFPQDEARARIDLAPTCDMVRFLEGIAGPYPFGDEKYAQDAIRWGGAMENQTATSLGQFTFTGTHRNENAILHELAHQWFGDAITPARWPDIWLNEGFARYAEALWREHLEGRQSYLDFMQDIGAVHHADLFTGGQEGTLADPTPILPNILIYDKGAWILHILRGYLGDERFFIALHAWGADPLRRGGNVTTGDFVAAFSQAAGEDLGPILEPWLQTTAVPVLAWNVRQSPASSGSVRVTLELVQRQDPVFVLAVPVRIGTAGGVVVERADLRARSASFTWTVPTPVDSVAIDPEGWLLRRLEAGIPPVVTIEAIAPDPVPSGGAQVRFRLLQAGRVTAALYDLRGRKAAAWDLGERRASIAAAPGDAGAATEIWAWNGKDAAGRRLPAGVYALVLESSGARATRRVTLVH